MKRIIAIILIVISLFACIPLGSYAADTEIEFVWKDMTKTSIKEDLPDLDFAQYVKNAELFNIYVVTLCEQYENKRLYIYIYYPFQDSLMKRGKNKIQMKCGESWEKYNLEYISDYNNIIKFRVMLPDAFFDNRVEPGETEENQEEPEKANNNNNYNPNSNSNGYSSPQRAGARGGERNVENPVEKQIAELREGLFHRMKERYNRMGIGFQGNVVESMYRLRMNGISRENELLILKMADERDYDQLPDPEIWLQPTYGAAK